MATEGDHPPTPPIPGPHGVDTKKLSEPPEERPAKMVTEGDLLLRAEFETFSLWYVTEVSSTEGVFLRGPGGAEDHLAAGCEVELPSDYRLLDRGAIELILGELAQGRVVPVISSGFLFSKRLGPS